MDARFWTVSHLNPTLLPQIWPLARICDAGDMPFPAWQRHWSQWLRNAVPNRFATMLTPAAGGAACAAWMAELEVRGPDRLRVYTVVRLWLVELGRPGSVREACFTHFRRCAQAAGCQRLEVPLLSLPARLSVATTAAIAAKLGFASDAAGWSMDL